jgi:hypothetical protein
MPHKNNGRASMTDDNGATMRALLILAVAAVLVAALAMIGGAWFPEDAAQMPHRPMAR